MSKDILEQLNEQQREAVEYIDGPSLVIAGAGSGKTRVLTYKIAYLLSHTNLKPWNILALTFTNKAANEMKQRIGALVGMEQARYLNMGTFHSVFSHILRRECMALGYQSNFTIYDESDARSLVKSIIKEFELDDKTYKPANIHHRISRLKDRLISPASYSEHPEMQRADAEAKTPRFSDIYVEYQNRLKTANAMDFDDLLVNTYILFHNFPDIREKYAGQYQFVLVDEYQDTNYAQQCIILQLTQEHQHVCVVGDDAQSIYAFRGANIDNILGFSEKYNNARLFKLERNYRSTQRIVQAANSLIRHNERQIPKEVFSQKDEGDKLILKPAYSDKEEAMIVCNEIKRLRRKEGCEFSDFAILYRTNSQSRSFEEQMRKENIPYRIYGGLSFYQRKEIKDILAYFRLVVNPDDEEAFKRIINYPARGIGDTTVNKILTAARTNNASLWEVISDPVSHSLNVNKGTLTKIGTFRELIATHINKATDTDAYTLGFELVKASGISAEILSDHSPENLARQENLEEFLGGMQEFVESRREEGREEETLLTDFLQEVSLLTDLDSDKDSDASRVSLMTIHSAKGLEFPTVFIVGLEENIFPSLLSSGSMRELEEERRLFYVAITRAEKHCILTCAQNRYRYGKMEFNPKSRFIKDIDPQLLLVEDENMGQTAFGERSFPSARYQNSRPVASQFRADPKPKITSPRRPEPAIDPFSERFKQRLVASGGNLRKVSQAIQKSSASSAPSPLSVGQTIEHERFGIGTVTAVEGAGENTKATVEFRNAGTKQLLLKFARFKVIG